MPKGTILFSKHTKVVVCYTISFSTFFNTVSKTVNEMIRTYLFKSCVKCLSLIGMGFIRLCSLLAGLLKCECGEQTINLVRLFLFCQLDVTFLMEFHGTLTWRLQFLMKFIKASACPLDMISEKCIA